MRGGVFHNRMVEEAEMLYRRYNWQVYKEYRYQKNSITTYFDLYATRQHYKIACEIETTARYAVENIRKAVSVGIHLWVIVPTRTTRRQVKRKLSSLNINPTTETVRILLFCQLESELIQHSKIYY